MHVEEVHGPDGVQQLAPAWESLAAADASPSFFLSHAWVQCCIAGLPHDCTPLVLVVRDGSTITGLIPMLSQRVPWRVFPTRQLTLLQNQDAPFVDMLIARDRTAQVLHSVVDHLQRRSGWQVWCAPKLDLSSTTTRTLADCLEGLSHLHAASARSPVLHLTDGWESYWKAQSQRFKKTVRNVTNRIERLGHVEIVDETHHRDAAGCSTTFRDVATRSWKATLPVSILQNPDIARFFDALTHTLHQRRQLRLWVLRLDGTPIATEYHVQDGETVYALRSDFDDRHREASPGAHLNAHIVRTYFDQGIRVYDMGPGDTEYKQRWATGTKEQETYWLFNRTAYSLALYNMERRALPQLRRARGWWTKSHARAGTNADAAALDARGGTSRETTH